LFPNPEVICICNRFYELIIQLTLKATKCKDVDPGLYWSQLPQFFKADQKFFRENTNTCSLDTNPYGNSSWGYPEYWNEFLEELEEGMEIDAVKVGRTRGQTIWSRATVISQDDDKAIRIRFKRETDYHIAEQRYKLTPFTVNRKGTRCSDDEWDWRESLGPGDKVDVYVNDMLNDIVGWLACEITNVVN
jgi:ubiquitin carboxyl-terminal hydrolase 34